METKEQIENTGLKTGMFRHPFSFKGRIRRLEFGISVIIYYIYYGILLNMAYNLNNIDFTLVFMVLTIIPAIWFILAQTCKRLHDLDYSGWRYFLLFIPLYNIYFNLLLLFKDGDEYVNEYGSDPKGRNIYS